MTQIGLRATLLMGAANPRPRAFKIEDPVWAQIMNTLANGCGVRPMFHDRLRADQFRQKSASAETDALFSREPTGLIGVGRQ
jgi:hypothetical protein